MKNEYDKAFRKFKESVKSKTTEDDGEKLIHNLEALNHSIMTDKDLMESYANQYNDYKEEIMKLHERCVEITSKDMISEDIREKIDYASDKTSMAQTLADHLTENNILIPVYLDEMKKKRTYYHFVDSKGYWKEVSENLALEIAKKVVGNDYTRHFKLEYLNQLRHSPNSMSYNELGLPKEEILLRNGQVFNLNDGTTRQVRKEDYALNMINADPTDNFSKEEFKELVENTLKDKEQVKTFQEFIGYCLKYPYGSYEKALIILGTSNTGKSTILKVVRNLFQFAEMTELGLSQIGHERRFHLAKLANSILNVDEDMSSAKISDSSAVKQVISNEEIAVEPKGKGAFPISPKCKLMIASNVAPKLPKHLINDVAFYNRFLPLEAPEVVPREERNNNLVNELTRPEVLNGIFRWAWQGLQRLEENNGEFSYHPRGKKVKDKFDEFGSSIDQFIAECVEPEKGNHIPTTDVYEYYELWVSDTMNKKMSRQEFLTKIKRHNKINISKKSVHGGRRKCLTNSKISVID